MFEFVKNEYERQQCYAYLEMILFHLREKTGDDWTYRPARFYRVDVGIGDWYFIHWHQSAIIKSLKEGRPEEYWIDVFLKQKNSHYDGNRAMKIFLDDERDPPSDDWTVVRNSRSFIRLVMDSTNYIEEVSFDNDLGEDTWEGYDCALFFVQWMERWENTPRVGIHTANPSAREKMRSLFGNTNFEVIER